jgi:hypothetical protein
MRSAAASHAARVGGVYTEDLRTRVPFTRIPAATSSFNTSDEGNGGHDDGIDDTSRTEGALLIRMGV